MNTLQLLQWKRSVIIDPSLRHKDDELQRKASLPHLGHFIKTSLDAQVISDIGLDESSSDFYENNLWIIPYGMTSVFSPQADWHSDLKRRCSETLVLSKPVCRKCSKPMVLLDEENHKWYCYKDDEVFYGKEIRWSSDPVHVSPPEEKRTEEVEQSLHALFSSKTSTAKKVAVIAAGFSVAIVVLIVLFSLPYSGLSQFIVWFVFLPPIWAVGSVRGMVAKEKQKRNAAVSLFLGRVPIYVGPGSEPLCPLDEVALKDSDQKALTKMQERAEKEGRKSEIYARGMWKDCPKCKTFWDVSRTPLVRVESLAKWSSIVASKVAELELAAAEGRRLLSVPTLPQTFRTQQYATPIVKSNEVSKSQATKYCRFCGAKIPRDSNHCEECGMKLSVTEASER